MALIHRALHDDKEARPECLKLTGVVQPQRQDLAKPPTIESSAQQIESARTNLEVFAKHSRAYMVRHGEREVCIHTH